jgi:diguanylate cyclase (GGDEF)-like protein
VCRTISDPGRATREYARSNTLLPFHRTTSVAGASVALDHGRAADRGKSTHTGGRLSSRDRSAQSLVARVGVSPDKGTGRDRGTRISYTRRVIEQAAPARGGVATLPKVTPRGAGARLRFALGALALALAAGLGTPAAARGISQAWQIPIEVALIAVGFLVAIASVVVGAQLGKRVDKLTDEARRDPMTRVGNRRHWEECLEHEVTRAAAANMPISLMMIDVDNLKKLNDVGGHGTGDLALSIVGDVLNETCRSRDVAARFGGDEFAVLLPRTRASEATIVADRIRAELDRRRACYKAPLSAYLSVSIGISDLASVDAPRPSLLFEAADRALYAAKQHGRDRVEVASRPSQTQRNSTVIILDERRRARTSTRSG